ncbi:MAG: SsrA-binding protein SmpB [Bacteroidia bacterium]|nr:SsrA-binding protein SmpB [Bacteroidia bacterium]
MSEKGRNSTVIQNRKARHEYFIEEELTAGIVLTGTEVKSLRSGKASLEEGYCYVEQDEVFVKGMNIAIYEQGSYNNHDPFRTRKLLLKKREIRRLAKSTERQGYTIVPLRLYFNDRNLVKVDIGLAKGKKLYDKRETLKERDVQRELDRRQW